MASGSPLITMQVPTSQAMEELGRRLAGLLRAGDLVVLSGDLGAGKTTLTRGLGAGLDVRGAVTSPTFVISRVHPANGDGPALVHVDAYRLGSLAEVDDLDLDASLDEAVTVVEWGQGLVEDLTADRLEVTLTRPRGGWGTGQDEARTDRVRTDEVRTVGLRGVGARWSGVALPGTG